MKNLVILGAGTAGTMVANRMVRALPARQWKVTVVDPEALHLYQPGLLFLPFGARDEDRILRPRKTTLSKRVHWLKETVKQIDPKAKRVDLLATDPIFYDFLVIASGSRIRPDFMEGLMGDDWRRTHHDFYTLEGAIALRETLAGWRGGRLVLNVAEMPIKCPVAPLEFLFLADDFFRHRGMRDDVELVYVTPLDAVFTKPVAAQRLGHLLEKKGIKVETEFLAAEAGGGVLGSYDERNINYDLLVSIPTHTGAEFIEQSGIGNELAFLPTHRHTLRGKGMERVFVLGDATDLAASKAGSVAHFQSDVVVQNLLREIGGDAAQPEFDGHANCFVETGDSKAMLIDFNYDVEPLPGHFPLPGIGPFSLLKETRINHLGKLGFRWLYWNGLLPAKPLPLGHRMSMLGKDDSPTTKAA